MELILAALKGLAAIPVLLEQIEKLRFEIKKAQDLKWAQDATRVRQKFERAANMQEVRDVLRDLSDLQRRL